MASLEIKPTRGMRLRVVAVTIAATAISLGLMYLLVGGGTDLFARRTTLTTYMPDAAGITKDSEVRLSGIRIGTVRKIELSGSLEPDRAVRAEMRVLTRYLKGIPQDSQTDVSADTLIGYQFIDVAEGKSPIPIGENGVLQSEPVKEASDRADLILTLQQNLTQVDELLAEMASPDSKVGQFITGEEMYDKFLAALQGFDRDLHTFLTPRSDLGKAFYTSEIYDRTRDLLTKADRLLASIGNGEGALGHFVASDGQYNDFLNDLTSLRATLARAGANPMLGDDESYRKAVRLARDADAMIARLNAGEGQTGRLLSNAQLYESLTGSLHTMEQLLRDLRENPRKYLRVRPF
ncbi:MAG TPA: MlaD family protein [Bryobacteraceae bacterium]|jgi:phospholipid/cholesterol/gamma-HCH transport system substrate-binding protein|nr:MlaD family protein [Bryobacteraceae bacterium]